MPTLLAAEVFKGSKIVTVAAGGRHTMAVGVDGALWAWGEGSSGQLGLGDTNERLVPTLVGAEEVFGGSKVRTIACGYDHTLAVTEAGELWVSPGAEERKVDWASTTGNAGWCRRAWTRSTLPTHPSPPLPLASTTRQP